jgi:glycosyltransferase involved in cell wall biosynthesis
MTQPRITICVPIWGRPQRTARIIDCLRRQTINNYQVYLIGDGCPLWQGDLNEGWVQEIIKEEEQKGNEWIAFNLDKNYGGYGYYIRNLMKELADGKYLCFIDNDDVVKINHLELYLSEIENTDLDWVFYNTWNNALGTLRDAQATQGLIGHSELCIKTEFFKNVPNQGSHYGHDFDMIDWMIKNTSKYKKAESHEWTYKVMGTPAKRETDID